MTDAPLVSVIIPNWNGAAFLRPCLDALRAQTYPTLEVIVADNASTDGSRELVAAEYRAVRLVALPENRGFTGACNAGIGAAQGEIVALLNNDTEAAPGWVGAVVDAFRRHPEAGMVASRMMLIDRPDTFHAAGDFYGVDGVPGNRGVWERDVGQYDEEAYTFSANGGAAAYRRAMLDQVGLLDDDFFFSCEDVDLAWRAQLAGWRCIYAPGAVVYHHLAATGGGATASYYDGRNFIYVLVKNYPGPLFRKHWAKVVRAQLRIAWDAVRAWRGAAARARLRGQLAGLWGAPRMWRKRRAIQRSRQVTIEYLETVLSPA
ncbi:MAG: glycosyltransferase family 2 protein [Anaerolineae bacterium]|nr:glycosyltransferase family 2 protein [Anaerolineae bacterium]